MARQEIVVSIWLSGALRRVAVVRETTFGGVRSFFTAAGVGVGFAAAVARTRVYWASGSHCPPLSWISDQSSSFPAGSDF